MRKPSSNRYITLGGLGLGLGTALLGACDSDAAKEINKTLEADVRGQVLDNRGKPVAGATVRLYALTDNTNFVKGGDITSAEAYIDKEAVLASDNAVSSGDTDAEGRFKLGIIPNAFFAVVKKEGCSAGMLGFNQDTGVLNVDTLIKPKIDGAVKFDLPNFTIACADPPPKVEAEGNTPESPKIEPPPPAPVTCDAEQCAASGGKCEGNACHVTCDVAACTSTGGTCVDGACKPPAAACDAAKCTAAGGTCEGTPPTDACKLPPPAACKADADCAKAQPGAYCTDPGDVAKAKCHPPEPAECTPPPKPPPPNQPQPGWAKFLLKDPANDKVIADASTANQVVPRAALPPDGRVRVVAEYTGPSPKAFLQVQSGGSSCTDASLKPSTDYLGIPISNKQLGGADGDFMDRVMHGGQISDNPALGQGERSFTIDIGDRCSKPAQALVAYLYWDGGKDDPVDLDLNIWNGKGQHVFVGFKNSSWGALRQHTRAPGPEVFASAAYGTALQGNQGPYNMKVVFFSGKPRPVEGRLYLVRLLPGKVVSRTTYKFVLNKPNDVAEIGVFDADESP
jgi:hypothetical protein